MEWRHRVLSDLVAGAEIGFVGNDLTLAERKELIKNGVLANSVAPDAGSELRFLVDDKPEWRVFIPHGDGFIAHREDAAGKPVVLKAGDAMIFTLNRRRVYDVVAADLSCRPDIQKLASGIWMIGAFALGNGTRARIIILERGVRPHDLADAVKALTFKCLFILSVGTTNGICDGLTPPSDKTIHRGILEATANAFFSNAMKESGDFVTPLPKGAYIDTSVLPPLLSIHGEQFRLPMNAGKPSDGVLLLEYLFDHPGDVFPAWELEGLVFPDRREKHGIQLGVDNRQTEETESNLKKEALKLGAILKDQSLPAMEIADAREELESIQEELSKARTPSGRWKQLGESDAQKATGRVRKALDKVVERVLAQNIELGQALDQALDRATEVQFRPPQDWLI